MLTQAIVTNGEGFEQDLLYAVSTVSSRALLKHPEKHETWLKGKFVKSVRKSKQFNKVLEDKPLMTFHLDSGLVAAVFAPTIIQEFPKSVKRSRVEGLSLEKGERFEYGKSEITVNINSELGMSSGKMAAQVAHGVMLYVLDRGRLPEGMAFEYTTILPESKYTVTDAGFTEIPEGSVTVSITD